MALFVEMIRSRSPLLFFPFWVAALVVPLALLGWWGCRTSFGRRVALTGAGYAVAFSVVGRIDTSYWGFLLTVLVIPGISLAPSAIKVLGRELRGRDPVGTSRSSVRDVSNISPGHVGPVKAIP